MAKPSATSCNSCRKAKRKVSVDLGRGHQDRWELATVIDEREVQTLFGGVEKDLLVQTSGGERIWVSYWKEVDQQKQDVK